MESLSLLASVSAIVGGAPASAAAAATSAPPNKSAGAAASAAPAASTSGPKAAPTQPSKPRPQAGSPTPCLTFQTSFGGFQSKLPTFKPPAKKTKPPQRPKPYTDYTLFFRLEKSRLAQLATGEVDAEVTAALDPSHRDPLEFPRPAGYEDVVMPPFWYRSDERRVEKMRRHRKRRGRMDMATLSKTISKRWRECEESEVVEYVRRLAALELERYEGEGVDDGKGGLKHRRERDGRLCLPKKRPVKRPARVAKADEPAYIARALQGHPPSMSPPHPTSSSGGMGVQIPRGSIGPFKSVRLPDGTVRLLETPSAPGESVGRGQLPSGTSSADFPGASGGMGPPSRTSAGPPQAAAWVSSVESRLRALEEERRRRALEEDELRRALTEHRRQTRPAEALMIRGQEMMSDEEVQRRLLEQEERVAWQAEMRRRMVAEEALLAREAEIRRRMVEEAEYRHRMMVEAAARARRMGEASMEGTLAGAASGETAGEAEGRLPLRKRGSRTDADPSAEGSETESKKRRTMDAVHHRLLAQLEQQAAERAAAAERSQREAQREAEAERSQRDAARAAMDDSSHGRLAEPALDRAVSLSPGAEVFAARARPR